MNPKSFYQNQAQAYFDQTFGVDPSSFLLPLIRHLSPGARILDVGCGAGRDMLWLTNRGRTRKPDLMGGSFTCGQKPILCPFLKIAA
ncbi:MAG: hypothetical protein U5L00_07945 [Desulfovermiculus sp.]|nr:hypothetical protein [Desulfovermiculus sp.]